RNVLIDYLAAADRDAERPLAEFDAATNMTDRAAALTILAHRFPGSAQARKALSQFEAMFGGDALVMDKWFQIQATVPGSATVERVEALMSHPGFSIANPNRVRSLVGTFASANQTGFHAGDGRGYRLHARVILEVEKRKPQVAARLATAFRSWRSLEQVRREAAREVLAGIATRKDLSRDLADIVQRTLG